MERGLFSLYDTLLVYIRGFLKIGLIDTSNVVAFELSVWIIS